jgi:hypothetical protein
MRSSLHRGIAIVAVIGCIGVVAAATLQDPTVFGERSASDGAKDTAYETTGRAGAMGSMRGNLPLTDEQRDRVYQGVLRFPDVARGAARAPELADKLASDAPMQDLPASVIEEIPLLRAHKFVKLDDRILLIEPGSRVVVAMIPRYRLLP